MGINKDFLNIYGVLNLYSSIQLLAILLASFLNSHDNNGGSGLTAGGQVKSFHAGSGS
jgi:hypothetical protein